MVIDFVRWYSVLRDDTVATKRPPLDTLRDG